MATLSFRLPAHRQQDTAVRPGARTLGAARVQIRTALPRQGSLGLVNEVLELQPPTDPSMIQLAPRAVARPITNDAGTAGWFDSTWDLQQGLEISEGLPADLPLGDWLKMYLAA